MQLQFLGTSAGVPTRRRNVTALAVLCSQGKGWFLIDCGEGTQHQVLQTSLSLNQLQGICITHMHGDHCYGLPGLLSSAAMNGRKAPLTIIAPKGIQQWIEATALYSEFNLGYELSFIEVNSQLHHRVGAVTIEAAKLSHRVPSHAYSFTEKTADFKLDVEKLIRDGVPRGPLWGQISKGISVAVNDRQISAQDYLIANHEAEKIVVGGDNDTPSLLGEICHGCQVLVHEATYTEDVALKVGSDVGHSYARLVAEFAQQAQIANLVLTHFSPRYQDHLKAAHCIDDIRHEAQQFYKGNLFLARDFATFDLDKQGQLSLMSRDL
ncbi:ribonuclease Z [Celerinatantimonas diazotrophica]|uniref:Ribonuclease Z n=1 Tax=Celerinatantimonas diazotrophica TaxID=412034 RepID=A0A4R1K3B8_9GAMM|nr:ribonuclease Z [Celerinatantimonas diazotrophica]TCK58575.1 ribonuclease Z [Celerinatantimonas diazotrophica]CAG9297204.1 Ribonuclease Z [Celerinatantimonas diazotrophica]